MLRHLWWRLLLSDRVCYAPPPPSHGAWVPRQETAGVPGTLPGGFHVVHLTPCGCFTCGAVAALVAPLCASSICSPRNGSWKAKMIRPEGGGVDVLAGLGAAVGGETRPSPVGEGARAAFAAPIHLAAQVIEQ